MLLARLLFDRTGQCANQKEWTGREGNKPVEEYAKRKIGPRMHPKGQHGEIGFLPMCRNELGKSRINRTSRAW